MIIFELNFSWKYFSSYTGFDLAHMLLKKCIDAWEIHLFSFLQRVRRLMSLSYLSVKYEAAAS